MSRHNVNCISKLTILKSALFRHLVHLNNESGLLTTGKKNML